MVRNGAEEGVVRFESLNVLPVSSFECVRADLIHRERGKVFAIWEFKDAPDLAQFKVSDLPAAPTGLQIGTGRKIPGVQ